MKRVINFVKGRRDERKDRVMNSNICVEITNPLGQKVPSEDEHIIGLQTGYGYDVDLSGKDKSMTKLHKSAWQGNLEKVKLHLKKFDINAVDEYNRTPLHLAAAQGHTHIVCFLLNNKAIADINDNDGMTPFLKAVECGVKECVGVLMERGVNNCATDNNGNTALHITAKQGFFNIMSMLLKHGTNCDCANNTGEMALHIAVEQEHRDLVELLLQAGAHVNVVDRDNRTPLMLAARVGQSSIVCLLLKYGAHLDACDNNGWTAEDYAMIGGHEQLAIELKVPHHTANMPLPNVELVMTSSTVYTDNSASEDCAVELEKQECSVQNDGEPQITKSAMKSPPYNVYVVEEEAQESPRSCVTPPPLNPPRSWEIIQAGMIDQTQVRRRSLMALGTLESHRESFVENGNGQESEDIPFRSSATNIMLEVQPMKAGSDTEWDSDDSLPLDRSLPPPPDFPDSSLESNLPLPEFVLTPDSSLPHIPELIITPDRRSRITLERTPSLDLTDSEILDSNKVTLGSGGKIKENKEILQSSHTSLVDDVTNNLMAGSVCSMVHDTGQAELTSNDTEEKDDMSEDNVVETFNETLKKTMGCVRESYSLDNLDECSKHCDIDSCKTCGRLNSEQYNSVHSLNTKTNSNQIQSQSLDSLEEESLMGTVVKRNVFHESHSLELLDEGKKLSRHHARNKSMSVTTYHWSKSVDVLSKPCKTDGSCLDRKRIDAQLQCYDEALRELAEEQKVKEDLLNRALEVIPSAKSNLNQSISCDVLQPKISTIQKSCLLKNHRSASSYTSQPLYGSSFGGSCNSNTYKDDQMLVKKSNTFDVLNQEIVPRKKALDINSTLVENQTFTTLNTQQKDIDLAGPSTSEKYSQNYNMKQTSCKQRSSSTSSKGRRGHFENKLKYYNSLELPHWTEREKKSKSESSSCEIINWKKSSTASSMNERQPKIKTSDDTVQDSFTENYIKTIELPKAPTRAKKTIRKEKSESDKRRRGEEKGVIKKGIVRSISMNVNIKSEEPSRKDIVENKEPFLSEKSESDSEWSELPLHNKRKHFIAMRGVVADSEDSNEEDPPFWLSTGKNGCFSRQDTVIHNQNATANNEGKKDSDAEKSGGEGNEDTNSSDTGSVSISHSEATPSHSFVLRSHQSVLKDHLKQATEDKARLEELSAKLKEQTERLEYDLADANQSIIARDDKVVILQDELSRLSSKYSATLDELNLLKQKLTSSEIELRHLRELTRVNIEKGHTKPDLNNQQLVKQLHESIKAKRRLEFEKENLMSQHIMDIKKLQQDTIHWKTLYEDAVAKLEQIEGLCDPCLMENNQHFDKVKSAFKRFRDEKNSEHYKIKSPDITEQNNSEKKSTKLDLAQSDNNKDVFCLENTITDNQVTTLQLQLQQEKSRCSALENQVQKMLLDLQTKFDLEAELENLNIRLEKEFVPRVELEQLRANQETAIGRIRQQALIESETKLNTKLMEINQILQLQFDQLQEQTQKEKQRELLESQMKQEFEITRQKLLLELSRVHAALKAKEAEERILREHCEAMAREAEKSQELKRRQLIEKSYSVNLADPTTTREKELTVKQSVVPPPPPPPPLAPTPLDINLFNANSLRQQIERSISKHRDIQLSLMGDDRLPSPPGRSPQ